MILSLSKRKEKGRKEGKEKKEKGKKEKKGKGKKGKKKGEREGNGEKEGRWILAHTEKLAETFFGKESYFPQGQGYVFCKILKLGGGNWCWGKKGKMRQ